jgi:hypothetical protein
MTTSTRFGFLRHSSSTWNSAGLRSRSVSTENKSVLVDSMFDWRLRLRVCGGISCCVEAVIVVRRYWWGISDCELMDRGEHDEVGWRLAEVVKVRRAWGDFERGRRIVASIEGLTNLSESSSSFRVSVKSSVSSFSWRTSLKKSLANVFLLKAELSLSWRRLRLQLTLTLTQATKTKCQPKSPHTLQPPSPFVSPHINPLHRSPQNLCLPPTHPIFVYSPSNLPISPKLSNSAWKLFQETTRKRSCVMSSTQLKVSRISNQLFGVFLVCFVFLYSYFYISILCDSNNE